VRLRALPLCAAFLVATSAAAQDDAARKAKDLKLRDEILEGAFQDETRLKAARLLEKSDPELLGATLLAMGEGKKNPANLSFLAALAVEQETRLLRLLAIHAAWQSDPKGAVARFLEKLPDDDRAAARAVEAAGLIAAVQKDRAAIVRILDVARGKEVEGPGGGKDDGKKGDVARVARPLPGIEAARAVNRMMEKHSVRELLRCAVETPDNHVRKHLVWAVLDIAGDERDAKNMFEPQTGRPGVQGKNARECLEILEDKEAKPFAWNPLALKEVPALWKTGRPKGLQPEVLWKDPVIKQGFETGFRELAKTSPAWGHYAASVLGKITLRTAQSPEIYDQKGKVLLIDAAEINAAESDWQKSYILARDAGIVLSAILGEPSSGHRGWEPAYADLYGYMKASRQQVGTPMEYVDSMMAKRPWPK